MSVGSLVLVLTSIVDTVSLWVLPTRTVLPSGVSAIPPGPEPTVMSVGFLGHPVRDYTHQRARHPEAHNPRTRRKRRIAAHRGLSVPVTGDTA
jgi:hypothetical protein